MCKEVRNAVIKGGARADEKKKREEREREKRSQSVTNPFGSRFGKKQNQKESAHAERERKKKKDAAAAQEAWVSLYVFFFSACKDKKKFYLSK